MEEFHDLVRSQALLSSAWSNPVADTVMTTPASEKRYRCATCGQNFSRAEHLKRHQTRRK
jgi:transposase-like protein